MPHSPTAARASSLAASDAMTPSAAAILARARQQALATPLGSSTPYLPPLPVGMASQAALQAHQAALAAAARTPNK